MVENRVDKNINMYSYIYIISNLTVYIYFLAVQQKQNPCSPSPCGPNSQCRIVHDQAICSCLLGYIGIPPSCRPECLVDSDCPSVLSCSNQKCVDPCRGSCGINAECQVNNHNPICYCRNGLTGDPFSRCLEIHRK